MGKKRKLDGNDVQGVTEVNEVQVKLETLKEDIERLKELKKKQRKLMKLEREKDEILKDIAKEQKSGKKKH